MLIMCFSLLSALIHNINTFIELLIDYLLLDGYSIYLNSEFHEYKAIDK